MNVIRIGFLSGELFIYNAGDSLLSEVVHSRSLNLSRSKLNSDL